MRTQYDLRSAGWAYRALALCCVCLIAFTGFLATVHVHSDNAGVPDHSCSICALAHAGIAPVELASPVPLLERSTLWQAGAEVPHSLLFVSSDFIRPPPLD